MLTLIELVAFIYGMLNVYQLFNDVDEDIFVIFLPFVYFCMSNSISLLWAMTTTICIIAAYSNRCLRYILIIISLMYTSFVIVNN